MADRKRYPSNEPGQGKPGGQREPAADEFAEGRSAGATEMPPGHHYRPEPVRPQVAVTLQRPDLASTSDQAFWVAIRERTHSIGFDAYVRFVDRVLCGGTVTDEERACMGRLPSERLAFGADTYQLLKVATEAFLICRCGVLRKLDRDRYQPDEEAPRLNGFFPFEEISQKLGEYLHGGLPYLRTILHGLEEELVEQPDPAWFHNTLLCGKPFDPCLLELIWSYWHEEGMLVQAMNTVCLRFQNKLAGDVNALSQLELSPLRPMSNVLWGYIQDEPFRLSVPRRAYEYSHHYGLSLLGKAVPRMRPADDRSKFLEAFHSLLRQVAIFYKEDADTTVIADGFPLLNSLQEVHLLLAEGAQNQFRDLPWTARVEMLIQKWLLSRREIQDFLRGRPMVPYKEPWMGPVDSLRRLLGWGDTPVTYFRDLGVYGEQILLSIRYGNWGEVNDQERPKNWARYFQPEIQGYLHAYRAVTGVDLGVRGAGQERVDATPPSVLLERRLAQQRAR